MMIELGRVFKEVEDLDYDSGEWRARMHLAQSDATDRMQDVFIYKPWVVPVMYSGPGPGASCNPPGPGTRWPIKAPLYIVNFNV